MRSRHLHHRDGLRPKVAREPPIGARPVDDRAAGRHPGGRVAPVPAIIDR